MADVMIEVQKREGVKCPMADGIDEINKVYGDATSPDFRSKLIMIDLPFPLVGEWFGEPVITRLLLHPLIKVSFLDVMGEIVDLIGEEKLMEQKWNRLGDAYSYRKKKGGSELSCHSWGIAIDLNPLLSPWLKKSNQPKVIVDAFERRGWTWGGRWRNLDGMHFQAASGY
jgi:hypothetical protein